MKNRKGFTIIELLAVVVIIGLLTSIAIVGVTKYIDNSRRKTYIAIAKEYIDIASNMIAHNKISAKNPKVVYYIHINNLETNDGKIMQSPYGEWVDAYVIVTIDNENNYTYYWTSVDKAGMRIDITKEDELKVSSIYNTNDLTINSGYPIGGRDVIDRIEDDGNKITEDPTITITEAEASHCYTWTENESNEITVTGYDASCGSEVNLPSAFGNKKVVSIANGAFKDKGLTKVWTFTGIRTIGSSAFHGNNLTEVKISSSVKTIGAYAFMSNKISNLVMSEGVVSIGSYAFANNKICKVELPASLTTIGSYAFYGNCLTNVSLTNSNVSVGSAAFSSNNFPESNAFIYKKTNGEIDKTYIVGYGGTATDIVIPEGVKTIGSYAFANTGIKSVSFPSTLVTINSAAFYSNKLTTLDFSKCTNLKTIGTVAFRANYLTNITDETLPSSLTSIGGSAFSQNSGRQDVFIHARNSDGSINYAKIVSWTASSRTSGFTNSVDIPEKTNGVTLTYIVSGAFSYAQLKNITLPDLSVCKNLTIEQHSFRENQVPEGAKNRWIYKVTNGSVDYTTISDFAGSSGALAANSTFVIPEKAYVYNSTSQNSTSLKKISNTFSWEGYPATIVIPKTVTSISGSAFCKVSGRQHRNLVKIVNLTGNKFDFKNLTCSNEEGDYKFVTGTVKHEAGKVEVTDHE